MKYGVSVEKRLYATGIVTVEAESEDDAIAQVEADIVAGRLQTTAVEWGELEYEDSTFQTTGDVD